MATPANPRLIDAWRLLRDIADEAAAGRYSASELWSIKNSAEVFANEIRKELRARDVRAVDEACALQEKTE